VSCMENVALITVTHDPQGKNIELYESLKDRLKSIYSELYITISEFTHEDYKEKMQSGGFNIKVIPKNGAADARRKALEFGLSKGAEFYHYCDFDRLLTWVGKYPSELEDIVQEIPKHDYLILGRTERAFNTHPIEWIETERISNRICSLELGQEVDITAGSCGFSKVCGEYINKYSKDKMTDSEWPMIIHRIAKLNVDYTAVEGLEYREEVNGYSRIITDTDKWFARIRLAYVISESAVNTGK
jgi:hypothetical protein